MTGLSEPYHLFRYSCNTRLLAVAVAVAVAVQTL
jgi:hypothetical protein